MVMEGLMKKHIAFVLILLVIMVSGCSNKSTSTNSDVSEIYIDDLLIEYSAYAKQISNDINYFTQDDFKDESSMMKAMAKTLDKIDISTNKSVRVRALVGDIQEGYISITNKDTLDNYDSNKLILCEFKDDSFKKLEVGETVVISGMFFKYNKDDNGTIEFIPGITDAVIESPDLSNR